MLPLFSSICSIEVPTNVSQTAISYFVQGAPEAELARLELSRNIGDYAILGDTKRGKADPSSRRAQYGTVQV